MDATNLQTNKTKKYKKKI